MTSIMDFFNSSSVGFTKENFAHGGILLDMHERGFPVFVAHRLPHHTFPVKRWWYSLMWKGLVEASEDELSTHPLGDDLLTLRTYAETERERTGSPWTKDPKNVPSCVAHYLHFWHLLAVALEHGIPNILLERLLTAPTVDVVLDVLKGARICMGGADVDCRNIAEEIVRGRQEATHMHFENSVEGGENFTNRLYRQKEEKFMNYTLCRDALHDLMTFCEDSVKHCKEVNKAYYGND